ncbi:MAG: SIMPL domain-containing protein [Leptolyngbya sp. SIO1D8]|nr:SIMPL domain-containing protein [Leptolyngbya sp. SIO1D8]
MKKALFSHVLSWTLAIGVIGLNSCAPAVAQEAVMRTLTVTGQGREQIQTTLAQVELGVEVQGRTAEAVQQDVAQRSSAVVELLRDRNVDKLQTTGIRLNPQYNYDSGQGRLVGYIGVNTVSFEVPTEQVGTLLDDAVGAGATQIQGVNFRASEDALAEARQVALQQATAEAQAQANTVLSALNLGAQEIIGIQINGATGPIPFPLPQQARLDVASAEYSTPVVGGEQTVEATVTLQIRY